MASSLPPFRRALWQFLVPVGIVATLAAAIGGVAQRKTSKSLRAPREVPVHQQP